MNNLFENMINSLSSMSEEQIMAECMSLNSEVIKDIPLRYRVIGMGFWRKLSLDELNEKLEDAGCSRLYSRNYKEAGLMYAFLHHLSYHEWVKLSEDSAKHVGNVLDRKMHSGKKVTLLDLKNYVEKYSEEKEKHLYTKSDTVLLNNELANTKDINAFYTFLENNKASFSDVREKARYYFCKYFLYFLEYQIDTCLETQDESIAKFLRFDIRKLKKMTKESFYERGISMSGIYSDFNYYYFGYPDSDWMDILLDYYGNIKSLPKKQQKELADSLRRYNKNWVKLSDQEVLKAQIQTMEENEKKLDLLYASGKMDSTVRSRNGERMIREFFYGEADIDRTSLLCYLLYFGQYLDKKDPMFLDIGRINDILTQCGYGKLKKTDEFDRFIEGYVKSSEPIDYLMNTVTRFAMEEKNFYLYHMYSNIYSNSKMFEKYMR